MTLTNTDCFGENIFVGAERSFQSGSWHKQGLLVGFDLNLAALGEKKLRKFLTAEVWL